MGYAYVAAVSYLLAAVDDQRTLELEVLSLFLEILILAVAKMMNLDGPRADQADARVLSLFSGWSRMTAALQAKLEGLHV